MQFILGLFCGFALMFYFNYRQANTEKAEPATDTAALRREIALAYADSLRQQDVLHARRLTTVRDSALRTAYQDGWAEADYSWRRKEAELRRDCDRQLREAVARVRDSLTLLTAHQPEAYELPDGRYSRDTVAYADRTNDFDRWPPGQRVQAGRILLVAFLTLLLFHRAGGHYTQWRKWRH